MSEKIWTRVVRPGSRGHAREQVVQLRKGAHVLDALMDASGAVVLTYKGQPTDSIEDRVVYVTESGSDITGGQFVRTVRHPGTGDVLHVFVADAGQLTS